MLGLAFAATFSATTFVSGIAFLIPSLDAEYGISLAGAALLSAMPGFGMVLTLIGWGYVVDRVGERIALSVGLALTASAAYAAASVPTTMLTEGASLFAGGMAAASAYTASGRLVAGWFPTDQRGLAMGIRQTAPTLGIAAAALALPELGEWDYSIALLFPAALCGLAALACAVGIHDPSRPVPSAAPKSELANPYRRTAVLWRIHLASALLMVPQTVVFTFMLVWLIEAHKWSVPSASALVSASQLLGALGRITIGRWSDRAGSRMRPIRSVAAVAAIVMPLLAITDHLRSPVAVALMVVASVITVLDNGLAFTAIAEFAGRFWSGRAMGIHNTTQTLSAAIGPPVFGELIEVTGYPLAYFVCGLLPLLALPIVPVGARPPAVDTHILRSADHRPDDDESVPTTAGR